MHELLNTMVLVDNIASNIIIHKHYKKNIGHTTLIHQQMSRKDVKKKS